MNIRDFHLETLVDNGGDCEDTSILFATLVLIIGYGTVYLNPPDHMAVGVLGNDLPGYYWKYNSRTYYYCETTGENFKIGDLPSEFKNVDAYIYEINYLEQYNPSSSSYGSPPSDNSSSNDSSTGFAAWIFPSIFFVVILGITITVQELRKQRSRAPPQSVNPQPQSPESSGDSQQRLHFCRHCGASNKSDSAFCEKCGKQIG